MQTNTPDLVMVSSLDGGPLQLPASLQWLHLPIARLCKPASLFPPFFRRIPYFVLLEVCTYNTLYDEYTLPTARSVSCRVVLLSGRCHCNRRRSL